jgi:hypothetical protein
MRLFAVLALGIVAPLGCAGENVNSSKYGPVYVYDDLSPGPSVLLRPVSGSASVGREISEAAVFCGLETKRFCVHTEGIDFAIPRVPVEKGATWTSNGLVFRQTSSAFETNWMGQKLQVVRIESVENTSVGDAPRWNRRAVFLYSYVIGLVQFVEISGAHTHERIRVVVCTRQPCFAAIKTSAVSEF